ENLHEWRKQAKYFRHVVEILEPFRPGNMKWLSRKLHDLTDLLGDYRDLSLLRSMLREDCNSLGNDAVREELVRRIDRRLGELRQRAYSAGQGLFRENPGIFARRRKSWWKDWRLGCKVPCRG